MTNLAIKTEDINVKDLMETLGANAKQAYLELSTCTAEQKNQALEAAAEAILAAEAEIIEANKKDIELAKQNNRPDAYIDRLALDSGRIAGIASALRDVAKLGDPVGKILDSWERPNGLKISRVAVPLGVIGVIFESRPNVTADAGALCLKAGNAVILRCGSDSFHSSTEIEKCLKKGLQAGGLPENAIQLIPTQDRAAVTEMLQLTNYIDVIVPRGGRSLTEKIKHESKVPTFLHLDGNCHVYVNEDANVQTAVDVIKNAKLRRTGICGAAESIVIDESALGALPDIVDELLDGDCEIRGDEKSIAADKRIKPASDDDWAAEYLDAIISVKTVSGVDEAIKHINKFGSHHTDAVITSNEEVAKKFFALVDSAIVMQNASTQFADGGEFGMGAEIGIATGRMHARGPVGVEQLCTFKYVVEGDGQVRP